MEEDFHDNTDINRRFYRDRITNQTRRMLHLHLYCKFILGIKTYKEKTHTDAFCINSTN